MGWSGSYNFMEEWVRWKGDLSMSKTLNSCKLKTNLLRGCLCTFKICINHNLTESLGTPGWQRHKKRLHRQSVLLQYGWARKDLPARSLGILCCCSMSGMDADAEILALMQDAGEVHLEGIQPDSFIHWRFVVRQTLCDLLRRHVGSVGHSYDTLSCFKTSTKPSTALHFSTF